ncbi:hypothetical protein [Syntrophorhabdus aromaticivorans]|jgi:hypothetical protein|uniref:hypothetical protein n=1 Tax=Syntrophorhabdus aromaticivorans TaxID=328301 RepID=UPI000415FFAE|nr:hypothetical protein [Syntrophorhabdus aromaticivorans]
MYLRQHNKKVDGELFNTSFDFLFHDIASTYFKDTVNGNSQAKRGYSRDSRTASLFTVTVTEKGGRLSIEIRKNEERYGWALETGGNYIFRTNRKETDPKTP